MEKINFELDPDISLREKGTLIVGKTLLEQGINPTIENIKKCGVDGERSIMSSIRKLAELGYYEARKYRRTDGPGFDWKYTINTTREV